MILAKDFEDFVRLLNKHEVEYMVVGGYALAMHGKPRSTGDLDIWIKISGENADRMVNVMGDFGLSSMGFQKEDFLRPGYMSQIGYPPLRIDILNNIDGVEFKDAKPNMKTIGLDNGLELKYIGLKDFIKNKQTTGRSQDLADIKAVKKLLPKKNITPRKKGRNL
jgi:predicted nucleotidyltransferase